MIGVALIAAGANLHAQTLGVVYVITGITVTDLSPGYAPESVANDISQSGTVVGWAGTATHRSALKHEFGRAWDIGATFPGESSEILGINNLEESVGYRTVNGVPRPVYWDDSGWLDLDAGKDPYGFARAINDHRTITGTNSYGTGYWLTPWSPYRWIWIQRHGYDINNAGVIVGQNRGAGPSRIFRWDSGFFYWLAEPTCSQPSFRTLYDLSNPYDPWPDMGAAHGINNYNVMVGYYACGRAFVATTAASRDLGTLPYGSTSRAYDINDAGFVVGEADTATPPAPGTFSLMRNAGFIWHNDIGMVELPNLPNGDPVAMCRANALNNRNVSASGLIQVVGACTVRGKRHAVRWDVTTQEVPIWWFF
jgi:hypothetical protein